MYEWHCAVALLLKNSVILDIFPLFLYPCPTKLEGRVYWIQSVRLSIHLSVCPSLDDMVLERNSSLGTNIKFKFDMHINDANVQKPGVCPIPTGGHF